MRQCFTCKKFTEYGDCVFFNNQDCECNEYELPLNNSEGMFKHIFSFKGRIRRMEYCLTYLGYYIFFLPMYLIEESNISFIFAMLWLLLLIPVCWVCLAQGCKRCHDLGNSGWFQLIPFYGLWMIFAAGTEGINRYGTNPKEDYHSQIYKEDSALQV